MSFILWALSLSFFFLVLSFKVIVDSQELQVTYREVPCTHHMDALMLVSSLITG